MEKIHLVTESFSRKWSGIRGEAGAERLPEKGSRRSKKNRRGSP